MGYHWNTEGDKDVPSSFTAARQDLSLPSPGTHLGPCTYPGGKGGSDLVPGTFVNPHPSSTLPVQSFLCFYPGQGVEMGLGKAWRQRVCDSWDLGCASSLGS